ncbi:MAG: hypothetical protein NC489_32550, partial [Ruminococcus flavefaciens]|nr:hypothetical protein [Ruminococcus flavefaciens]
IDKRIAREEGWEEGREEGWEEGWEEGREEGLEEGRQEGEYKSLIRQACKKKAKGLTPEDAAEQLESDIEQMQSIFAIIDTVGNPENLEMIYKEFVRINTQDSGGIIS